MLILADILEAITGIRPPNASMLVTDAFADSRQVMPGSMFIALSDGRKDGHNFVGDAFHYGAGLALIDRDLSHLFPVIDLREGFQLEKTCYPAVPFCLRVENCLEALYKIANYWREKRNPKVIAVINDGDPTILKETVAEVLNPLIPAACNMDDVPPKASLPLALLRVKRENEKIVIGLDFSIADQGSSIISFLRPQIVIVNSLPKYFGKSTGEDKGWTENLSALMQSLPPLPEGYAILNYDEPLVRRLAEQTQARIFFYGLNSHADLWADGIESKGREGIHFRIHYRNEALFMRAPLIGHHSVHISLSAAAIGMVNGLSWHDIATGLRSSRAQLRLVTVHTSKGAVILDDTYSTNLLSTLSMLNLIKDLEGNKIAVLGDLLGTQASDPKEYELIGVRVAEIVQELLVVGDRSLPITKAAIESGLSAKAVKWVQTAQEAIEYLHDHLRRGDLVLVKGAGLNPMGRIVTALESGS